MQSVLFAVFCLVSLSYSQQAKSEPSPKHADKDLEESFSEIKKDPKSWAQSLLDAQEALGKFGYGTLFTAKLDERTQEALRAYQRRNNLTVTGDLDFATWGRINHDEMLLSRDIQIGPSYLFNDSDCDNVVTAEGIWLEQGKEPTPETPMKMMRIECFKSNRMCVAATNGETLITIQYLNVGRWDRFEIETQPDDLPCGREYIQINRPQKTVLTVNAAVYKNAEACTKLFGPPGTPMVSRLAGADSLWHLKLKALQDARERIMVIPAEAKESAGLGNH